VLASLLVTIYYISLSSASGVGKGYCLHNQSLNDLQCSQTSSCFVEEAGSLRASRMLAVFVLIDPKSSLVVTIALRSSRVANAGGKESRCSG
jgi:hypothetical protein